MQGNIVLSNVLNRRKIALIGSLACLLSACSNHSPAPVSDLYRTASNSSSEWNARLSEQTTYRVQPGDTLFGIAWEHSLDHENLAQLNNIQNNRIYPGQVLKLIEDESQAVFDAQKLLAALNQEVLKRPVAIAPQQSVQHRKKSKPSSERQKNRFAANARSSDKRSKRIANQKTNKTRNRPKTEYVRVAQSGQSTKSSNMPSAINWIWPVDGQIISRFSSRSNANRGLDIAGRKGQPVRATAPGKVVYRGSGLRGYGNLVIIKHNNDYLSAYAHNDKIHVSENEFVKAGQRIAEIGSSGAQREQLHFQIRYRGKPVDPLNYLPEQ